MTRAKAMKEMAERLRAKNREMPLGDNLCDEAAAMLEALQTPVDSDVGEAVQPRTADGGRRRTIERETIERCAKVASDHAEKCRLLANGNYEHGDKGSAIISIECAKAHEATASAIRALMPLPNGTGIFFWCDRHRVVPVVQGRRQRTEYRAVTTPQELIAALEKSTGPDRELDCQIAVAVKGGRIIWVTDGNTGEKYPVRVYPGKQGGPATELQASIPLYTASIDAAITLVPQGWYCVEILRDNEGEWVPRLHQNNRGLLSAHANHPRLSIALCIAALKSRAMSQSGE